jgi:hypothetical protein
MTTNPTIPTGAPCWFELFTSDLDRALAFYGDLFGWDATSAEEFGGYVSFGLHGERVAGAMANHSDGVPDAWTVYLKVDDVEAAAARAVEAGGQVVVDPMPVGDLGHMAVVVDPTGAGVGMWQAGSHTGFTVEGEPGSPSWFELHTRNFVAAKEFYEKVFGWDVAMVSDSDEFRYATLGEGDDQRAGLMDAAAFLPDDVPSYWTIYIDVADPDATAAKVAGVGGTVLEEPVDTPYGRLATIADATGARIKLRRP